MGRLRGPLHCLAQNILELQPSFYARLLVHLVGVLHFLQCAQLLPRLPAGAKERLMMHMWPEPSDSTELQAPGRFRPVASSTSPVVLKAVPHQQPPRVAAGPVYQHCCNS